MAYTPSHLADCIDAQAPRGFQSKPFGALHSPGVRLPQSNGDGVDVRFGDGHRSDDFAIALERVAHPVDGTAPQWGHEVRAGPAPLSAGPVPLVLLVLVQLNQLQ